MVVESDEDIGEQSQPLTTALETDAVQVHPGAKSNDAVTVDIGSVTLEGISERSVPIKELEVGPDYLGRSV